jgi:hypothetical protein
MIAVIQSRRAALGLAPMECGMAAYAIVRRTEQAAKRELERISRAARLDVGGIEYLVDDRDGRHYYYDVNALSNFVADAKNVVGFDPFARLADYLELRAGFAASRGRALVPQSSFTAAGL